MNLLILLPYLITAGFALGLAVLGVVQYRLSAWLTAEWRGVVIVAIVGIGALLSIALTTRTLNETRIAEGVLVLYEDYAEGFAASRWLSLYLLAASLVEIARGWIAARARGTADPARAVLVGMLAYYAGTLAIEAVAADHPSFSYKALYVPVLLTAAYHLPVRNTRSLIEAAKWVILALTFGSLVAAVVAPDFALHRPEPGLLPGIDWRLYGLTAHANTLGPIALLAILFELHSPSRRRAFRWLHVVAAVAVLVLAQSKTAWAAAPLILAAQYLPLALRTSTDGAHRERDFRRAVWTVVGALGIAIVLMVLLMAFDIVGYVERNADVDTLTGRTQIWDITLAAWRDNILFGYGAEIWGTERRSQLRMFHVGHAHNQIVQTLGEAGLAGLALLLGYLGVLLHAAMRCFATSRGIVLAVLMLMLVRFITEAPISAEGLLSWATFLHLLLLLLACHALRERAFASTAAKRI